MADKRKRMIVDLPPEVCMAIKLRAVKSRKTTGQVVAEAIKEAFPDEVSEARESLAERDRQ